MVLPEEEERALNDAASDLEAYAYDACLPHDAAIMQGYGFPTATARSIRVPTIVISGDRTFKQLKEPVRLTRETIPGARFASLPGQSHDAAAELVALVLIDFLGDKATTRAAA